MLMNLLLVTTTGVHHTIKFNQGCHDPITQVSIAKHYGIGFKMTQWRPLGHFKPNSIMAV